VKSSALVVLTALLARCAYAQSQSESESEHVPPDPPQSRVHSMPYHEMVGMMGMDDRSRFAKVMLDRLEWQDAKAGSTFEWDAAAWYGGDYDKVWLETEGTRTPDTDDARIELAWDRIISPWWSLRAGGRHDAGTGPARDWLAFGVAGLAPGFIAVETSLYLGEDGRTALRLTTERDFLITQRLVLQPEAELNAYGKDDPERLIGAGLSDLKLGLRLRYEARRELAPYFGVRWVGHFGGSADLRRAADEPAHEFLWLAGIRAWF
jgi:copper resistance protein B